MEKRKKRMKKREKEGLGFPKFSGTYFRELIFGNLFPVPNFEKD